MPRVKLKPLDDYSFKTDITVRITDLNYGGHLGNDALLSLLHEARVLFLKQYGFTELDCGGVSLIMSDTVINYKGEAFNGDVLTIKTSAGEPTRFGFRIFYHVSIPADKQLIALAETGMVCFDYNTRKRVRVPEEVHNIFH